MVGPLHDDDSASVVVCFGNLDGVFDGFAAAVGEEEGVEGRVGHEWQQAFDQADVGFGVGNVDLGVDDLL